MDYQTVEIQNVAPITKQAILIRERQAVGDAVFTRGDYKSGEVKHIVLFRYAEFVSPDKRNQLMEDFLALQHLALREGKPYIVSITAGKQASGEGVNGGFEQGFIVTFRSQGDRNYYVGTPVVTSPTFYDAAHQNFKNKVGPFLAKKQGVLVFDFVSGG
ncbi:Dabb family protein [Yersinia thracica]|uniref:Dabb family protein n=1 Tax=Yersinia thracica TaxID=2890319 RepID=UPI00157C6BFE|nr:Dabb family protein [Yersinia thracica]